MSEDGRFRIASCDRYAATIQINVYSNKQLFPDITDLLGFSIMQ